MRPKSTKVTPSANKSAGQSGAKREQDDEQQRQNDIITLAKGHQRLTESRRRYRLKYHLWLLEGRFQEIYRRLSARVEAREKGTRNEEWLLDNRHIVQETVALVRESLPRKFLRQLPKVTSVNGHIDLRARALAETLVADISQPLDMESILQLVDLYQTETILTTGELWALPALLRLSLLQQLVELAEEALDCAETESEACGVGIASAIISLRELRSHDWRDFVESLSRVEQVLREDPAAAYRDMDFETRDTYRNVVEKLARGSGCSEEQVARQVIELSDSQAPDSRGRHIGYYLIGDGRPELEKRLGFRPDFFPGLYRLLLRKAPSAYFAALALFSAPPLLALAVYLLQQGTPLLLILLISAIAAVPLTGLALALVNGLITHSLPPHKLPKLDFDKGLPDTFRSAVVMPVLFADAEDMRKVLECLEINYLNNDDRNLVYAVLSDFADADKQHIESDKALLQATREALDALNRRYADSEGRAPFLLLHRERRWNPAENCWMGWERKRGKLLEFNQLLRGCEDTSFTTFCGDKAQLRGVRYVITLDADSQMPPGTARRLVGTMAHPLNRAEVDSNGRRVVAGYGFLQPRLEIDPGSSPDTVFTEVFSGDRTVDLYTHAVSDAYQDLFGEAIFAGKGIYDPQVFERTLAGQLPENAVLSHDLLEGALGGAALLSDTVFYEQYPPNIFALLRRSHRWIRGDWQLLPWLRQRVTVSSGEKVKNPLPSIHRWKIADNLRRSLEAPCLLILFLFAWTGLLPGAAWLWTVGLLVLAAAPVWLEMLSMLWRSLADPRHVHRHLRGGPGVLRQRALHWILSMALLPCQAFNAMDAILRTLYRLGVSRRHLLEWTSAAHTNRAFGNGLKNNGAWREQWISPALAIASIVCILAVAPLNLLPAAPLLAAWLLVPLVVHWISRPYRRQVAPPLSARDRRELRLLSRRTWFFFEYFMGPDDHWLPPDNYQEEPLAALARRTSPTNIGLGLLSILTAYDFGYLDLNLLLARLNNSFERMRGLERYRGHFLNWYETRELHPLNPRYVSTVDSGNLAASLLTLAQGLESLQTQPLSGHQLVMGIADTLGVVAETLLPAEPATASAEVRKVIAEIEQLRRNLESGAQEKNWWECIDKIYERQMPVLQERVLSVVESDEINFSAEALGRLRQWLDELQQQTVAARRHQEQLEPWQRLLQSPPLLYRQDGALADGFQELEEVLRAPLTLASLPQKCQVAEALLADLESALNAEGAEHRDDAVAWNNRLRAALREAQANVDGYRSDLQRLAARARQWVEEMDFAFLYDPDRHLFHIGYNVTDAALDPNYYDLLASESRLTGFLAIAKGDVPARHWRHLERPFRRVHRRVVLMSWSATLFEYLMPRLLMETPDNSLMGRACRNAVEIHREFTAEFDLPWGIAESGYYELDSHLHYQYRAFGVPGIGFRRDLGERIVVSPYASLMALPFGADAVMENLRQLRAHGCYGQFGLYEAIDFGRTAKPAPRRARTVRSYMSHHQGMILLAINNYLHNDIMLQRFHSDVRISGLTPLLYERLPSAPPALKPWRRPGVQRSFRAEVALENWTVSPASPQPHYNLLSNGHYTLVLAADGAGGAYWHNIALTRWQPDPTQHQWGRWNYVRDLDSGEFFSLGLAPCGGEAGHCNANFSPHQVEFQRREAGLFCRLRVALSSQHDVEVRQLIIKNERDHKRRLLLASYAEVVLAPDKEDQRHPAFAKLFVESRFLDDEQVMLYRRRPRSNAEKPVYLAHSILVQPGVKHRLGWETDRLRFLGRGGDPAHPRALENGLEGFSGTTGPVLDPVIATGQEVIIPPQSEIEVIYLTGVSRSRREILSAMRSYRSQPKARWIFDLARMQSEHEVRNLQISGGDMRWMMDLLSAVLAPSGTMRAPSRVLARSRHIQPGLWSRGISGDNPILLVQIRSDQEISFAEPILEAHTYWCGRGIAVDLVILDEESAGYAQQTRDRLQDMIADIRGRTLRKLAGSVVLVAGQELPGVERIRLLAAARVILDSAAGPVTAQLEAAASSLQAQLQPLPPFVPVHPSDRVPQPTPLLERPADLQFDNGIGGFSADGREYILHLQPGQRPPAPWVNVIANPNFGCLVSEGGSCCTWSGNSGEHRLTAWNNDPVRDPSGEVLYLRDEETAEVWTPTPAPRPTDSAYQVCHGAGYSEFRHNSHGLKQTWRIFVDREAPVKIGRLTLTNCWDSPRRLTATYYVEWVQGLVRATSWPHLVSEYVSEEDVLLARNAFVPDAKPGVAFLTSNLPAHGLTTDRHEFLGRSGGLQAPEALFRIGLSGRVQCGIDPCAAYQVHIDLKAGESQHIYFVMGEGTDRSKALALAAKFRQPEMAEKARAEIEDFWENYLGTIQVELPDRATELMLNRWLPYQTLACRLWGRSGFYQSSGAFGFRDQLQDVQALLWTRPDWARAHILRAASRQFQDGDVLHWWHEQPLRGVRTRCSDDLLWLPFVTAQYIRSTGDYGILHEQISYLQGAPLAKDEHERYAEYESSEESGSLYEHCCRAIERAGAVGPHGLPVIGNGDWNDGFNRISTTGRGESVWMGWFLLRVCRDMAPLCDYIGDSALANHYRQLGENLRQQVEKSGWDGAWYRRAYYDDGTPVGSKDSDECKIDLIAQTWSVLSQEHPTDRSRQAMESAYKHLVREKARQILLLTPAFDRTKKDPGYIKGYPPGIRENGGQYTHAATWAVWAAAGLGQSERAWHLFNLINPITHTSDAAGVHRYRTEPYVLAGDVYGVPPHVGRGGWTWYSGASGWLYRGAIEALLGLQMVGGDTLEIRPCLPDSWSHYRVHLRFKSSCYEIDVHNCGGCPSRMAEVTLDGVTLDDERIPLVDDGTKHRVKVIFDKVKAQAI
ncbi:GH36-type glycosyl hydrolase domain-containing protein [Microbulbifer thermotolerans]|uniref:GH36-type glycosyl hydrolase domain-containing protein n=1 Tax=Microbulbifer thermotolerans TaxID=252514 RepID=UPI0018D3304F|nr:glucoamylase family protein [Microbulbifer thermotolerans]